MYIELRATACYSTASMRMRMRLRFMHLSFLFAQGGGQAGQHTVLHLSARLAGLALPFQPDNALFQSIPNTSQLSSDGYTIEEKAHVRDFNC